MKLISFLLRQSRLAVTLAVLTGVISGACNTGLLAVINSLITGTGSRSRLLFAFVALCVVVPVTRVISELLLSFLGQQTVFKLRLELSRRVLDVPLRRLEELGPHRVLSSLTEDVPTITNVVGLVPTLAINLAVFTGCLVYLAWLSWKIFALILILIVVGVVAYQLPIARAAVHMAAARRLNDDLYNHFRALTEGLKELKLHRNRRDDFLDTELYGTALRHRDENLSGLRIYTLASSWGQIFVFLVVGLLLFFLPRTGAGLSPVVIGYTLTLLYLMSPLQTLMNAIPNFARAGVSMSRIDTMGLRLAAIAAPEPAQVDAAHLSWRSIELRGITHSYRREGEDGEFVLGPIDLTLHPGEVVFIAGGNGSGKTTLAKLLTGLYVPDLGEILWDGRPVDDGNRDIYRQSFSAVFSDFFLFTSLLGIDPDQMDAQAAHYLKKLHLQQKVRVTDGKLSTVELSQGQRKRLALLTAYLEDRPVYLFDEWAADQDPFFKEVFYRQLLPELKRRNKAVVVISHDDRYFDAGDRLIKLESGQMVVQAVPA